VIFIIYGPNYYTLGFMNMIACNYIGESHVFLKPSNELRLDQSGRVSVGSPGSIAFMVGLSGSLIRFLYNVLPLYS